MNAGPCAKTTGDDEGTIKGCGKNKKDALKDAGIARRHGSGRRLHGGPGFGDRLPSITATAAGPGFGTSIGMGAGIGAGTVLIYDLLKHEKHIILVQGTTMTFVISRSVDASTGKPLEPTYPLKPPSSDFWNYSVHSAATLAVEILAGTFSLPPGGIPDETNPTLLIVVISLMLALPVRHGPRMRTTLPCPPEPSWW